MLIVENIMFFLHLEFHFVGFKVRLPYFETLSAKWKASLIGTQGLVLAGSGHSVDVLHGGHQF